MRTILRSPVTAPAVDALCLVVFVVAGRQSHGLNNGGAWFFVVLWPVAIAWFATALLCGLYTRTSHPAARLATTVVVGVGLGLIVRAVVTHRDTPAAFVLVAYGYITLTTVGWRLLAAAAPSMLRRRRQ